MKFQRAIGWLIEGALKNQKILPSIFFKANSSIQLITAGTCLKEDIRGDRGER